MVLNVHGHVTEVSSPGRTILADLTQQERVYLAPAIKSVSAMQQDSRWSQLGR